MKPVCATIGVMVVWLAAGVPLPARPSEPTSSGGEAVRLFDPFDGKLALDWKPVRPDPTHVSLETHPGMLAIVTQRGSIHENEDEDPLSEGIRAKNLFLVENPLRDAPGFVATTCVDTFQPKTAYHQAGLILYDDDDNYVKLTWERLSRGRRTLIFLREEQEESVITPVYVDASSPRLWLRLTYRGGMFAYASSTDGKDYTVHGELPWGDGAPRWAGLVAKNGGNPEAEEIEARFDFFELRALNAEERNDPRFLARQQFQGTWRVTDCQLGGKPLGKAPLSQITFQGGRVTIREADQTIEGQYEVDPDREPHELTLIAAIGGLSGHIMASYAFRDQTLLICFNLQPRGPAPPELETQPGDNRLLVTLRKLPEPE